MKYYIFCSTASSNTTVLTRTGTHAYTHVCTCVGQELTHIEQLATEGYSYIAMALCTCMRSYIRSIIYCLFAHVHMYMYTCYAHTVTCTCSTCNNPLYIHTTHIYKQMSTVCIHYALTHAHMHVHTCGHTLTNTLMRTTTIHTCANSISPHTSCYTCMHVWKGWTVIRSYTHHFVER